MPTTTTQDPISALAATATPDPTSAPTATPTLTGNTSLVATAALPAVSNGATPGSYNAVFGLPLNIDVPSEAPSSFTVQVTSLPTNGTVVMQDGSTPVSVGQSLTPAQAGGLRLKPNGVAQSSHFDFKGVIPGQPSIPGSVNIPFNSTTNSITLPTTAIIPPETTTITPNTTTALTTAAPATAAPSNPNSIVLENEKPGTPQSVWEINPGDDSTQIQGFTTNISTPVGASVQFKINNQTGNGTYQINIYRLGYYGGDGATLVTTINHSGSPVVQPNPLTNSTTGEVDAGNWSVTDSWAVPSTTTSGVYVANVIDGSQVFQIPFVVSNPSSTSNIVFQTSDETWQAYNGWGGDSLYGGNGPGTSTPPAGYGGGRAFAVSYNRPIVTRDSIGTYAGPQDSLFGAEYAAIYWLEENGYDVSYISGLDTATNGSLLLNHKVFMDAGHDEYWTDSQVANVQAAQKAGVNAVFLSGNEMFWQTRFSPSIDSSADPNRTLVSYKDTLNNLETDPSGKNTGTFEDPRLGSPPMPSNQVTGTMFQVDQNSINSAITIPYGETQLRIWRNTSVATTAPGQTASLEQNLLGYEWDASPDNPFEPGDLIDVSSTTVQEPTAFNTAYGEVDTSGTATNNLVEYRDQTSGALVFGAGTVFWSWGLSNQHDNSPSPFSSNTVDPNAQQATVNMLADMGVQPQTLQASLVLATQSTDHTPPTSTISNVSSSNVVEGQTVTVTGTATDSGGGVIGGVEVSTDGGKTWNPANSPVGSVSVNWTYSFAAPAPGAYTIESRAIDDSVNIETPSDHVSYTVTPSSALTLFSASTTPPIANDPKAVEVGVKFTASTSGLITGIRFYKGSTNTGTHVGDLWTASGALLASATFTNETASGWQQVNFSTPVSITAGTTYVASYHTNTGNYADTPEYFTTYDGQTVGSLNAPGDSLNGVFAYSASDTFPNTASATGDNFWVDVVFNDSGRSPPSLSNVAASASYAAGGTATTLSSGATVSDPNSGTLVSGTVSIVSGFLTGDTLAATTTGTSITASYSASTGVLSLTGSDTLAHYQQVLDSVSYASSNQNPTNSGADPSRTASWVVNDGTVSSAAQTTTVNVSGGSATDSLFSPSATPGTITANDPSAVDLGVKFQASSNGSIIGIRFYKGPQNTGAHTGDLWSTSGTLLASATFTNETASGWQQVNFSSPVSITAGATYIASYEAPVGEYSADSNYFTNSLTNGPLTAPSSSSSGGNGVYAYGSSNPFPNNTFSASNYWVDVVFSPSANPTPPVLSNVAASASYAAGGTATTLSSGATVSDPESANLVSGTVSITNGFLSGDTLAATTTGTSIAASYSASTGVLSLTGTDTLAHYQQVLDSVTYASSNQNPTNSGGDPNRTISWVVNDGTLNSATQTTTVNISGGPATDSLFSPSATPGTITENDPSAVDLGVKFQASSNGSITGIRFYKGPQNTGAHIGDLWTTSGSLLASATFTNETASGWQQVNFSSPVSITAGATYIASYEAPVGEYSADQNYFTNALTNGPLTAPSTSSSGGNGVYAYGSSNPFPTSSFSASNYWVDVVFSPSATQTPPVLSNVAASASYTAGGTATTLSSGATVSDPESATLISATVSIANGFLSGDTLAATTTGTSIAASYSASTGVLNLTGSDTLAHYQQVLDSVSYSSSSQNPTNSGADTSRKISWVANDGALTSATQTTTLNITGAGQPPVLSNVAASASYAAGGTATTLSSGATVSDPESANLVSGTVSITSGLLTGDTLAATTTGTSIAASYSASTGVLSLTGSDTLAHYQQVLDSVSYSSSSQNPTNSGADTSRKISWVANDGALNSATQTTTLNITGAGQPPVLSNVAASASYAAGGTATTLSSGATVSDPESANLVSGTVSITNGFLSGDTLAATTTGTSIAASYSASTGVLSLTGSDTLAHYQQVLDSVSYVSSNQNPTNSGADPSRTVSWVVNDGTVSSATQTTTVNVSGGPTTDSLFSPSATPTNVTENDPNAVDLGVKFQASTAGVITGIRFYKGPQNTGAHTGDLWSTSGTLLASATFTNETASGWQQVNFSSPVSITADATYIASYEAPVGEYSADSNYFTNSLTNGPLTAPSSSSSGGNGVYAYGSSNLFPNNTFSASNYWVDVVFSLGAVAQPSITTVALSGGLWQLSGSAAAASTVTVFDGATQLGTTTANSSGGWSFPTNENNSAIRDFTAAGNAGPASAAWFEGTTGADLFSFASEAALAAPAAIFGNGGSDTLDLTTPTTLADADFAHVHNILTMGLTGASSVTLGTNAASASIANITIGNGATNIADSNSGTLNVNAGALATGTLLTLSGSEKFTVTGLQGNLAATNVTGTLNVTTSAASALSIATGGGADTITASAMTQGETLTLTGSHAATVAVGGNLAASAYTGKLTVTASGTASQAITTGSGADSITAANGADTITAGAGADTINVSGHTLADSFVYNTVSDSPNTSSGHDTITGFLAGTGTGGTNDTLDFSAILGPTYSVQALSSTSTQVNADSIAWIFNSSANQTLAYVNATGGALSQTSNKLIEVALAGNIHLAAANLIG